MLNTSGVFSPSILIPCQKQLNIHSQIDDGTKWYQMKQMTNGTFIGTWNEVVEWNGMETQRKS